LYPGRRLSETGEKEAAERQEPGKYFYKRAGEWSVCDQGREQSQKSISKVFDFAVGQGMASGKLRMENIK
jgi:hypothetical protein